MAGQTSRHQEQQLRTKIGFMFIAGCATLLLSVGLPLIAYGALSVLAVITIRSITDWNQLGNLGEVNPVPPLDTDSRYWLAGVIGAVGFLFYNLDLFSKVFLCTVAGAGIAGLYIHECVFRSQAALNNALATAVKAKNTAHVTELLNRGADPFAQDELGNNAFHHCMNNHANAATILTALQRKADEQAPLVEDVLYSTQGYFNADIYARLRTVGNRLLTMVRNHNFDTRAEFFQALSELGTIYNRAFIQTLTILTRYLRSNFAYPTDINTTNNAGLRPIDVLKNARVNQATFTALSKTLADMGAKESVGAPVPTVIPTSEPNHQSEDPSDPALASAPQTTPTSAPTTKRRRQCLMFDGWGFFNLPLIHFWSFFIHRYKWP
jgi:ankyrin repeat protein